MDHPFYDSVRFPFHLAEGKKLHDLLVQLYNTSPPIQIKYSQVAAGLPPVNWAAPANAVWFDALNNIAASGFVEKLLQLVRQDFPGNQALTDLLAAIETAKPISEKKLMSDTLFVLDCEEQRRAIRKAVSDDNPGVVLIRGKKKSGKSHCRYIFKAVAEMKGATMVYLYEGMVVTEHDAIKSLFSALGEPAASIPPRENSSSDAWYIDVCNKLREIAQEKNDKKIWIVVDDLGYADEEMKVPKMAGEIRKFFEQFSVFLLDPSFYKYFRLLLIDYSETSVPTRWKDDLWSEVFTDEANIKQSHVEDFLREWKANKAARIYDEDIQSMAADILARADQPEQPLKKYSRLRRIHLMLETKIDELNRKGV